MTKYQLIASWLESSNAESVAVRFEEVEIVLGFPLPRSAKVHRAWWGNEHAHHRHTHCRSWLDAGYESQNVDLAQQKLVFRRVRST